MFVGSGSAVVEDVVVEVVVAPQAGSVSINKAMAETLVIGLSVLFKRRQFTLAPANQTMPAQGVVASSKFWSSQICVQRSGVEVMNMLP